MKNKDKLESLLLAYRAYEVIRDSKRLLTETEPWEVKMQLIAKDVENMVTTTP